MGTSTTADKLVMRRFAIELLSKQMTIADVARVVGVSEAIVKRWKKAFRDGGDAALHPKPSPSSPTKGSPAHRISTATADRRRPSGGVCRVPLTKILAHRKAERRRGMTSS
jgi:transposase